MNNEMEVGIRWGRRRRIGIEIINKRNPFVVKKELRLP